MADRIYTDVGLLDLENMQYLYKNNILTNDYGIRKRLVKRGGLKRPMSVWEMFCLVKDDIASQNSLTDINDIVGVMREERVDIISRGAQIVKEMNHAMTGGKSYQDFDI